MRAAWKSYQKTIFCYPTTDWFSCHFVGKSVVVLQNVLCFLRLESQSLRATPNKCRPANSHDSAVSLKIFYLSHGLRTRQCQGFFWEYTSDLKCYLVEKKKEISWNASACLSLDRTSLTFWPRS